MNARNMYIDQYIEKLCSGFDDGRKDTPLMSMLQDLQKILPVQEWKEVQNFTHSIQDFRRCYNDEIPIETSLPTVKAYEAAVSSADLPNPVKLKFYEDLLSYFEREQTFSPLYFAVLDKKIALIPEKDDAQLTRAAWQVVHAHRGVSRGLYLRTLQRAYNKFSNKPIFPRKDILGIESYRNKRGKFNILPVSKMSKEQVMERYNIIQEIFQMPLTSAEKISLAEEKIELATRTSFQRTKNFEIKRDMNQLIAQEYIKNDHPELAVKYEQEVNRWQRNIGLSMDKGYERSGRDFDFK